MGGNDEVITLPRTIVARLLVIASADDPRLVQEKEWLEAEIAAWMQHNYHKVNELEPPCTCPNPEPHDWPHDPNNPECFKNAFQSAVRRS